jgi:head-tail adaptor
MSLISKFVIVYGQRRRNMERKQRISAGAIVVQNELILLVRYRKATGKLPG